MRTSYFFFVLLFGSLVFFSGCDDNEPEIPNEEELITTLTYTLTPSTGGAPVVFTFQDLDGDGGNAPVITNGTLQSGVTYTGALSVLNESQTPADNITTEIEDEDSDHQFFFAVASGLNLAIAYNDADGDGNPVGLLTTAAAGAASSGNLTITLRHLPMKTAEGVRDGNISNAGGETDIEVIFTVTIQ